MISMQRSLSSPVCIHSSPPVSPTATHPSSRSPTPSPETRPEVSRPRRFRSRSPVKPASGHRRRESSGSVRKIGGGGGGGGDDTSRDASSKQQSSANPSAGASAPKKPVIAQAVGPSKPPPPPSPSPGSSPPGPPSPLQPILKDQDDSGPLPRSLLADVSLYTNPHLTPENEGTTLEELAHLVRLSKYQERKCANTRIRLQRSLISTALSARLTRCGEISLRNLADSFRNDDKRAFANLFGAIHDVRNSCDATRRYALLEPEMESLQSSGVASVETLVPPPSTNGTIGPGSSVAPFFNDISASAREAFLSFLTQIRTNPDYLATRLCALNTSELQALTAFHQGLEPIESVLPYHGRATGRGHTGGPSRQSAQTPNAVERLLSFQRHDPLSALIYTCFANSAGPDSAEDKRRTGIWATAFARLISTKSTSEPVLISILNAWSAMRDWSGRANMEWYLMKILEDGAFLLDRAEDQNGTRFNLSGYSNKESIAAEEFYDRAVNDLFTIIDDEDATGIPEGVIELGNEILRRLEINHGTRGLVDTTRKWFVYKWLFSSWLLAVVIHPESYGMMAEYHITEYSRQKILKQVATTAQHAVVEMLSGQNPQRPVSTPLKIKGHVENILARFKPSGKRTGRLLPARSITSLRETVEVHPYLVLSPADLVTLVNALFPERRPQSAHSSSIRSGAPSISGFSAISQPISIGTSRSNFDTVSVLSMSTSSVFSDGTTSGDPLLEETVVGTPQRRSPTVPDGNRPSHATNYEDDGYRLRLAMHEMVQNLGPEVISGACHPCAERWAVVFISADGNSLSLQMTYDPDDDAEEENSSTTSDTEDDEPDEKPELDKDYHQLRDSVLKLVEDFEIPQGLEDHGNKTTFSNRASGLKKYRSKNKIITTGSSMGSRNPYRNRCEEEQKSKLAAEETSRAPEDKETGTVTGSSSVLITMLAAASSQSRIQSDFVSAHLYWKTLQQLNALTSPSLRKNGFATLLNIFSRGPRDSIRRSASAIEEYDAWLVWLKQSQERHEGLIETMMKRLKALRDKMWYVTDVHNSAPYEHTRNICSALKIMGAPGKWGSFQRNRAHMARGPASAYIFRNESQMLDLLAASEDQGGPNKLSDAQAEITSKWLEQFGIQNLCSGEERIHRFCCEVDSCIGKLVGENIVDGPVLWSSELYSRDRKMFEGSRTGRDRESVWGDDAASVISGDHERRYASPGRPGSMTRDLRNMSAYNGSQVSLDSHHRYSFSRASTALSDNFDAHDYFGASSPIHAIDSTSTFWSPFQSTMSTVSSATSRAQSPTTSVTNLSSTFSNPNHQPLPSHHAASRSGASVSSNETVHLRRLSEGKQRFLSDLRQTLTSLLLSELGNIVFSSGSETDGWFGNLGQECIERRDIEERKARKPVPKRDRLGKASAKQRVIEKRKSFGNLRQAGEASRVDLGNDRPDSASGPSNESSATSDTASARGKPSRKKDTPEFPYVKAYRRLLGMFAVHPNPYTKLGALLELERLVAASLSNGGRRSRWASRHQSGSVDEDTGVTGKAEAVDPSVESARERRPQQFQSLMVSLQPRSNKSADARSIVSVKEAANTDAIAQVLRSLFKDAGIRPKTLFRDLQFINSFVSPTTLDTDRNKPFWDIVVVTLGLKQDVITTMVEVADEILNFYTPSRQRPSGGDDSPEMLRKPPLHSLQDAASMWTIAAKEGNATAQRELALFTLGHPELVERSTLPLSKPRDVFKQAVMEKFGPRSGSGPRHSVDRSRGNLGAAGPASSGMQDAGMDSDVRSDPTLMCVAIHWMKEAERGGDELARTFLSQNEMMGL